jgi:hypothetical protein
VFRGRQEKAVTANAYDEYKMMYSLCDIFNRLTAFNWWSWDIRRSTCAHNFAMASILENLFNVYLSHNSAGESN